MPLTFCSLASGSSGNCQYVASPSTRVLIDAGMSGKYVCSALESIGESIRAIDAVLLTHEHSDHTTGLRVLLRRYGIPLYITESTYRSLAPKLADVPEERIRIFDKSQDFRVGDLTVRGFSVSHDAADPLCYRITHETTDGATSVGVVTDLGWVDPDVIEAFGGCDLLMIESNHDVELLKIGAYPMYLKRRILSEHGHLSNEDAGYIAREILRRGVLKHILLAHLSKENNFPDLAFETVRGLIEEYGFRVGEDVDLDLTHRDRVGKLYYLGYGGNG
ncbi:MAG: MBL fold metallo-hydrolase [Bacillota bacterium]|nr:MBL fold metallo-hydrolase [Bacillota bacterium]